MRYGARRRITGKRAALLVAWLLGVIGIIGTGGFASFTSSASGSTAVTSGTMTLTVPVNGTTNRLSVAASNIVPGDTIERVVDLVSGGNVAQTITLATSAGPSSLLDTDGTNGLQMVVDSCSLAGGWTESGSFPYTYTCPSGTITTVIASRAVIGSALAMSAGMTNPGTTHLHIKLTFPSATSSATFQGLSSTVTYAFTGAQRAGQAQ